MPQKIKKRKKSKTPITSKKREVPSQDAVLVVLEDMHDDIKLIAEAQTGLRDEFHEFKEEMYSFKDEMYSFKDEMYSFRDEMCSFRSEVYSFRDAVLDDLEKINYRLGEIENEIRKINRKIEQKADKAWVKEQINLLEKQLTSIKAALKMQ